MNQLSISKGGQDIPSFVKHWFSFIELEENGPNLHYSESSGFCPNRFTGMICVTYLMAIRRVWCGLEMVVQIECWFHVGFAHMFTCTQVEHHSKSDVIVISKWWLFITMLSLSWWWQRGDVILTSDFPYLLRIATTNGNQGHKTITKFNE